MRCVNAQFRPNWRPSRGLLAGLTVLAACSVVAVGLAAWEYQRLAKLRMQVARLVDADHVGGLPPQLHPIPPYDTSARQFLRERSAGWASMLRTLESGATIGVTPTALEFNATDGVARVELNYVDSTELLDYLGRINGGVAPGPGLTRWTLVQTQVQPGAAQGPAPGVDGVAQSTAQSVATIHSAWQESSVPEAVSP